MAFRSFKKRFAAVESDGCIVNNVAHYAATLKILNIDLRELKENANFLIDTGASICIIKKDMIRENTKIYKLKENLTLTGIGQGFLKIENYVILNFPGDVSHTFFIVDNIPFLQESGIIGNSFFNDNYSIISYANNTLTIRNVSFNLVDKKS